ncbi:hypothetical protein JOC69_001630 [Heliobacterium gestii]|nr:hypothetical protein [Heliomicrobium gestii]
MFPRGEQEFHATFLASQRTIFKHKKSRPFFGQMIFPGPGLGLDPQKSIQPFPGQRRNKDGLMFCGRRTRRTDGWLYYTQARNKRQFFCLDFQSFGHRRQMAL